MTTTTRGRIIKRRMDHALITVDGKVYKIYWQDVANMNDVDENIVGRLAECAVDNQITSDGFDGWVVQKSITLLQRVRMSSYTPSTAAVSSRQVFNPMPGKAQRTRRHKVTGVHEQKDYSSRKAAALDNHITPDAMKKAYQTQCVGNNRVYHVCGITFEVLTDG